MPYRSARHLLFALQLAALVAGLLLLFWPEPVRGATAIHKCRDAHGALHYQDAPCPAGTAVPVPPLADDPVEPVAPAVPASSDIAGEIAREATPFAGEPPRIHAPPLYACERYDGQERYVTEDPEPRRYQVPLWTVIAHAGPAGGAYTWVEDRCRPLSTREQCARWRARRGEIEPQRRRAFKDELEKLDAELAELRGRLAAHCA